jgi:hypothetical protein
MQAERRGAAKGGEYKSGGSYLHGQQTGSIKKCVLLYAVGGWRLMLSNAGRWYRYIDTRLPGVTSGCQKKKRHFEIAS